MFASSVHQLTTMVKYWEEETTAAKFIGHRGKSQFIGMEILGALTDTKSPTGGDA